MRRPVIAKRFELIEHTADVGIAAYGDTLALAFANAAYGLFSLMADLEDVKETAHRDVEVAAEDPEGLLVDWLNELLYIFDVQAIIFKRFDIVTFTQQHLEATCYGEKYDPSRHHLKLGVKAATHHMLRVDPEKKQVQVILDV